MRRFSALASRAGLFLLAACLTASSDLRAQMQGASHAGAHGMTAPSVAFDAAGRPWVVWMENTHVWVGPADASGKPTAARTQVTRETERYDANGESRPKIALGAPGEIFVTWTRSGSKPFTGEIRFARSLDGGKSFSAPRTLNDDGLETGHRFDQIVVSPTGEVLVTWIDKRDLDAATAAKQDYAGAALYLARSTDRGATFQKNRKLKDHICECCRIALALDGGTLAAVWRDVIDGHTRDHGFLRLDLASGAVSLRRATNDGWKIDACPHHGPSLTIGANGTYHLVYFTGDGPQGAGAFYQRSTDRGGSWTVPRRVGSTETFGHADIIADGQRVALVIKERVEPADMTVQVITSADGGATWSEPIEVLRTTGASDHPFLHRRGSEFVVSWHTKAEGLRLAPLVAPATSARQQ